MGLFRPKGRSEYSSGMRGSETEAQLTARFITCGYVVLRPVGESRSYDLVIEDAEGQFWRIQCKTGRYIRGSVQFLTASIQKSGYKSYKKGSIDYFGIYCPQLQKCYLVPVDQVGDTLAALRIDEVGKRNQHRFIRWAADYEL